MNDIAKMGPVEMARPMDIEEKRRRKREETRRHRARLRGEDVPKLKVGHPKGKRLTEKTKRKMSEAQKGSKNHNWNGGKYIDKRGYVEILLPDHHRADSGGRVFEHIIIAEKALGKPIYLPIIVHHANGIRGDNRNCNLVICPDNLYHALLHKRTREAV